MSYSLAELILALGFFFGGSLGLPMGVPPGPEDPNMFRVAPENALFYATWVGTAKIEKESNPTEAWMAQPELSKTIEKLRNASRGLLQQQLQELDSPSYQKLARLFLNVSLASSEQSSAFYLTDIRIENEATILDGGALIGLGQYEKPVRDLLDDLENELAATPNNLMQAEVVDDATVFRLQIDEPRLELRFQIHEDYFLIGLGRGEVARIRENLETPPPKWLNNAKQRLKVDRFSSMSFLDTKKAVQLLPEEAQQNSTPFQQLLTLSVGEDVDSIGWVSGLDKSGFLTRCLIRTNGPPQGVLAAIDRLPIDNKQLSNIPVDAGIAIATRLSVDKIVQLATQVANRSGQRDAMDQALDEFQQFTGVSLREEFVETLGDYVFLYLNVKAVFPFGDWVGMIEIKDEMSFPAIFAAINEKIEDSIEDDWTNFKFSETKIEGYSFFAIEGTGSWDSFIWGLINERWYFAGSKDAVSENVKGLEPSQRLANHPTVKEFFAFADEQDLKGPVAIFSLNLPAILEAAWPFIDMVRQQDSEIFSGFDFRFSDIPDLQILTRDVQPGLSAIYRSQDGFEILQRQTYPGASPGVTVVASSVLAFPYILSNYAKAAK